MKKNIRLNKQIIKALSIGISASMLLQPVSAMAAEVEETPAAEPSSESTTVVAATNAYDTAEAQADVADGAVEDAITASEDAVDAVKDEAADDVKTAAGNLQDVIDEVKDELADDCDDAKDYIEQMETQKALIDAWEVSGNNAAEAGNAAVDTADAAEVSANDVAQAALDTVTAAV
ncbi:MAG: hypothetical protein IKZ39_09160, partial [Lachnospiraceae bacterium]|nr:hypothetical protein [Lachnospiraceae bacterium]